MNLLTPNLPHEQFVQMNTLTLAHMGDCVFELLARTYIAQKGVFLSAKAHRMTVSLVSAKAQAKMIYAIIDILTEEEKGYFLRGRNSHPKTLPKNVGIAQYMAATGLETLFGALYLNGEQDRVLELFNACIAVHEGSQL